MATPATAAEKTTLSRRLPRFFAAPALKLVLIGLLLLLMLLPLAYVSGLIVERQARESDVLSEFRSSWGPQQTLVGPILVVPYRTEGSLSRRYLHIAPVQLTATAQLHAETRKRGIFRATVYSAPVELAGVFQLPAEIPPGELQWSDSFIVMLVNDLRGLPVSAELRWNGRPSGWIDCSEVVEEACSADNLLVARAGTAPTAETPIKFEATLAIRGTEALWLAPLAKNADVALSGAWPTPSFGGVSLPDKSNVTAADFSASWHVANNRVARHGSWVSNHAFQVDASDQPAAVESARIGVALLEPVPTYRMIERASKYGILFLALSFLTYFLFETVSGARIHVVQYGLLGLSIALFALLLISFSEPLGFSVGYALSALMVQAQASLYTATVTGKWRHAATFAAILAALFGFLYVVLILETYSLLVGSVALFAVLSATTAVTRHIEWSRAPSMPVAAAAGPKSVSGAWLELD